MNKEEIIKAYQVNRLYIFHIAVAISSLILIVFVIYPQAAKLIMNQQLQGDIFNKFQFIEAKVQALESYNSEDLNQQVEYAISAYPANKDYVNALALLQNMTTQAGFSTTSMSLEASALTPQPNKAESFNIKMDLVGQVNSLPSLLSAIENSPRIMRVGSVEVISGKDAQSTTISLVVDVLYASTPTGVGSIDSPLPVLSEKEQEVIAKLAVSGIRISGPQIAPVLGPRGKANPFE